MSKVRKISAEESMEERSHIQDYATKLEGEVVRLTEREAELATALAKLKQGILNLKFEAEKNELRIVVLWCEKLLTQ